MKETWKRLRDLFPFLSLLVLWLVSHSFGLGWSLNDEGKALLKLRESIESDPLGALSSWIDGELEMNPCSWSGVECSEGKVVALDMKDLCLRGRLPPELANLAHIKSIILRNNSFFGTIPKGIGMLTELEFLDLGYNNFSGPLPVDFGNNLPLAILLLDNNDLLGGMSREIFELVALSECQVDERIFYMAAKVQSCNRRCSAWNVDQGMKEAGQRRLQQVERQRSPFNREIQPPPTETPNTKPSPPNSPAFPPIISSPLPFPVGNSTPTRDPRSALSPKITSPVPNSVQPVKKTSSKHWAALGGGIGGALALVVIIGMYLFKTNKVATVKPWATGLSGQLQKAFVTGSAYASGVPKLKRSELEAACEDFSNVIGTSPSGTVYKGTLSSGVEIAVASMTVTSNKDWSKNLEAQFRKKVEMLSKVSHKNFINLLGYCEEEEPFTRMVIFEYAPNGTLFEHLHIQESEHLDWLTRMRIAMGMAYCLQHLHQLNPPITHSNLNSSSVYLTEDYAAKISEFSFWNKITSSERKATGRKLSISPSGGPKSNVYSFGVILFEMITGQLPYSADDCSLEDCALNYLQGRPLREMVDPTLNSFREAQLDQVADLIKLCCQPNPLSRPTMKEVCETLKKITGIKQEGAAPKLSPLWWAELEILSADGS